MRVRAKKMLFVNGRLIRQGEVFDHNGRVGINMESLEPVNEAKPEAAKKAKGRRAKAKTVGPAPTPVQQAPVRQVEDSIQREGEGFGPDPE